MASRKPLLWIPTVAPPPGRYSAMRYTRPGSGTGVGAAHARTNPVPGGPP